MANNLLKRFLGQKKYENPTPYLELRQYGRTYDLYHLPKGFVIKGDLDISDRNLTELPDLSDVVIEGSFSCSHNKLTTLKGAPKKVGGKFECNNNRLTTLKDAPQEVGESFDCENNQLTTLEGAPQKVGLSFKCDYNTLISLDGAPAEIITFSCNHNHLTTLKGAPKKVRNFWCNDNQLTTLENAPGEVSGDFRCNDNQLISLKGVPEKIGGNFCCGNNQLTTLEGGPKEVGAEFRCDDNPLTSLFGAPSLKKGSRIYCDDALAERYGLSKSKYEGYPFKELKESTLYKIEIAHHKTWSKMHQERLEKEQKTKEAFDAWLKNREAKSPTR